MFNLHTFIVISPESMCTSILFANIHYLLHRKQKVLFQSEDEQKQIADEQASKENCASNRSINDDNNTDAKTSDKEAETTSIDEKDNYAAPEKKTRKTPQRKKSNVIVVLNTTKHSKTIEPTKEDGDGERGNEKLPSAAEEMQLQQTSSLEPCSICLADYDDGDDICWSQNDKCNHFFHKECIQTWLLTHEECPCCRRDFLHLWGDEDEDEGGGSHQLRRQSTGGGVGRGLHGRSSRRRFSDSNAFDFRTSSFFGPSVNDSLRSSAAGGGRTRDRRDWVEELAVEIQDRILERQRELQAEFYRQEQEERQRQFVSSLMMGPQSSAASLNHHYNSQQLVGSSSLRNSTNSADDTGWLLYRHFPFNNFGGTDSRRQGTSNADLDDNTNDEGRHNDEDVQVADLTLPRGLEPWQTHSSDDRDPVIASPTGARTPSFFEMVERSTRRLGEERLPPRRQSQPTPIRFLNAGRESSHRFMRRSSNTGRGPRASAARANTSATAESVERRNRDPASRSIDDASARIDPEDEEILNSADA